MKDLALKAQGVVDASRQHGSPEFQVFWFIRGACPGFQWQEYWEQWPIGIIRNAIETITDHLEHGFINNLELMMTKAAGRAQGAKF